MGSAPMMRAVALLLAALPLLATAHPLSRDFWSLRAGIKADDEGLALVLVLEIPDTVVVEALEKGIALAEAENKGKEQPDTPSVLRKAVADAYKEQQFEVLRETLTLQVGGKSADVTWEPHPTPINGRASAGFFQYIVHAAVKPDHALLQGETLSVVVASDAYANEKMVYSGLVKDGGPWKTTYDSVVEVLGEDRGTGLPDDPRSWSDDKRLRRLEGRFARR